MELSIAALPGLIAELPWHIQFIGWTIVALGLGFIGFFLTPALQLGRTLRRTVKALGAEDLKGAVDVGRAFKGHAVLEHLWSEYHETLHEERVLNPSTGVHEVARLRATLPSALYFSEEVVVDSAVRTEFFKHLPGILTGIGIIGTFSGLILGIQDFTTVGDADAVKKSLDGLLHSVWQAFLVSAGAITLAMIATGLEKGLLVRLYRGVERLSQAIDEHYKSGVGEEYLSRLVNASEESASQTRILKDSLVEDLRGLLTELTDRQIAATAASSVRLGQEFSASIRQELHEPLERISHAVGTATRDQGTAVQTLLTDVLASFTERLQGLFGNQQSGIHEMQQQTTVALQSAVAQIEKMAMAVEGAGVRGSEEMAKKIAEAVHKLETRQTAMNAVLRQFVQDIREQVGRSQSETSAHLNSILADLATRAGGLVGDLSANSRAHVDAMGSQMGSLVESIGGATRQIAIAVDRIEGVTTDAIGRMNSGAETLAIAADDFAKAGNGVSGVLGKSEGLTRQLTEAAGSVGVATRSLDGVLVDYRTTRDTVREMLDAVRGSVEAAKREASLTTDVLQRIESSTTRLGDAQKRADEYLAKVTVVLDESHTAFADNVGRTLSTANKAFYDSLTQATKLLREAISELEQTLGSLNPEPAR